MSKKEFNTGFLRGLIDTDGSCYIPKTRVSFSTVSPLLAKQTFLIISDLLKIEPKWYKIRKEGRKELNTLTLHGDNARKLIRLINPTNQNRILR